jgi:hypothetical protein
VQHPEPVEGCGQSPATTLIDSAGCYQTRRDATNATTTELPARELRARDYLAISAYAFALSYLWNSLGPLVIPQLIERQPAGRLDWLRAAVPG